MFIYNVTTKIFAGIESEWLLWLKNNHIPDIIATGCFTETKILKLLDAGDDDGPTYAVQYFAESKSLYNLYLEKHAPAMRQKAIDAWGNKFIAFRSFMQIVE